jgi:hypothetical protein
MRDNDLCHVQHYTGHAFVATHPTLGATVRSKWVDITVNGSQEEIG